MKARYRYRVYPKPSQINALNQLFGCCRVVWNDALNFCDQSYQRGEKYCGESELQKQFITAAKNTEQRQWLSQVSNIPLQQSIRDLGTAYSKSRIFGLISCTSYPLELLTKTKLSR